MTLTNDRSRQQPERFQVFDNGLVIKKYTKKMIVALKTTDQRESLDYWLT